MAPDLDVKPERSRASGLAGWVLTRIATSSTACQILVSVCVIGAMLLWSVLLANV